MYALRSRTASRGFEQERGRESPRRSTSTTNSPSLLFPLLVLFLSLFSLVTVHALPSDLPDPIPVNFNQSVIYLAADGVSGWDCGQNETNACNNLQNAIELCQEGGTIIVLGGTFTGYGNVHLNISKSVTIKGDEGKASVFQCDAERFGFGFNPSEKFVNRTFPVITLANLLLDSCSISIFGNVSVTFNEVSFSKLPSELQSNVVWINADHTTTFNDCVFSGNFVLDSVIKIVSSSVVVTSTLIFNNSAKFEAPISSADYGTSIVITSSNITANQSPYGVGGVSATGADVTISHSTFSRNNGTFGAIYLNNCTGTITNASISNNLGISGGAVQLSNGDYLIEKTQFVKNSAYNHLSKLSGGAITVLSSKTQLNISECVFNNNSRTGLGSAIKCNGAALWIQNSSFTGNQAAQGGAIYYSFSEQLGITQDDHDLLENDGDDEDDIVPSITILGSNFTENTALISGGAIVVDHASQPLSVSIIESNFTSNYCYVDGGSIWISIVTKHFSEGDGECSLIQNKLAPISFRKKPRALSSHHRQSEKLNMSSHTVFLQSSIFLTNQARRSGGAIYSDQAIQVNNCSFANNSASLHGGAIYLSHLNVSLIDSYFLHNTAEDNGGAIAILSDSSDTSDSSDPDESSFPSRPNKEGDDNCGVSISGRDTVGNFTGCWFVENISYERAGAVYINTNLSVVVNNCTFRRNVAYNTGGAISLDGNTQQLLTDVLFESNVGKYGGAFAAFENSQVLFFNTRFVSNFGHEAGAIMFGDNSHIHFNQTLMHHNEARTRGGCLLIEDSCCVFLFNSTVSDNLALTMGGGMYMGGQSTLIVNQTTIENNRCFGGGGAVFSTDFSVSTFLNSSFLSNQAVSSAGGAMLVRTASQITSRDVVFRNNSGLSFGGAVALRDDSNTLFENCEFRENTTPAEGGAVFTSDLATSTFNSCTMANNTAGTSGGAVALAVRSSSTLFNCTLICNYARSKGGALQLQNQANATFDKCVFTLNNSTSGGALVIADDSTPSFTNSNFTHNYAVTQGGGVLCSDFSTSAFTNCLFDRNNASNGIGGALATIDFNTASFLSCTFSNNNAKNGGGVYVTTESRPSFMLSVFVHNLATLDGAGLVFSGSSAASMSNCSVLNNLSLGSAGGLSCDDTCHPTISFSLFANNSAVQRGGGMQAIDFSSPTIDQSEFTDNFASHGGGIYVGRETRLIMKSSKINENIAMSGAGMYVGSGQYSDMDVDLNVAINSGGGVVIEKYLSSDLEAPIAFEDSRFTKNSATNGGAVFVFHADAPFVHPNPPVISHLPFSLSSSSPTTQHPRALGHSPSWIDNVDEMVILKNGGGGTINFNNDFTFKNATISHNSAFNGGGIFYGVVAASSVTFGPTCTLNNNTAKHYGGAVFQSPALVSDQWMQNATFENNSAFYAGSNAAWYTRPSPDFCVDCVFDIDNDTRYDYGYGYDNGNGFATTPTTASFGNQSCPSHVYVSGDEFKIEVLLKDYFGNLVKGPLLFAQKFSVKIDVDPSGSNCSLNGTSTVQVQDSGRAEFSDLVLSGMNDSSCVLTFTVQSVPDRNRLNTLQCNVSLSGCPPGMEIAPHLDDDDGDGKASADTCTAAPQIHKLSLTTILWIVVGVMFMLLCFAFSVSFSRYMRKRKKKRDIEQMTEVISSTFTNLTVFSLLSDPKIPKIPWEDLEFGEIIGRGAAGIVNSGVYKNKKTGVRMEVAIKRTWFDLDQLPRRNLEEFLREIKLVSELKHPNIVRFVGITTQDNMLYLVTELMKLGSLSKVMQEQGASLPWAIRLKILKGAAKGLAYLHSRRVIHRDIKPQNLLVDPFFTCKVTDFGISTLKTNNPMTVTVGTPVYMAPDVINNSKYTEKADVYSFGIVIVEVYTGEQPYSSEEFRGMNNMALMKRIQAGLRPDISALPPALAQLVFDCLQEDPQLRPSFSEIIIRLRRCSTLKLPRFISIDVSGSAFASPNESISLRDEFNDLSFSKSISRTSTPQSAVAMRGGSSSSSFSSSKLVPQRIRFAEDDLKGNESDEGDEEESEEASSSDNYFTSIQ